MGDDNDGNVRNLAKFRKNVFQENVLSRWPSKLGNLHFPTWSQKILKMSFWEKKFETHHGTFDILLKIIIMSF